MAKLYPPQLEGALPAFYKSYDDDGETLLSCTINIPFGINRAVNIKSVDKVALRLRTTSTNTYLAADKICTSFDRENNIASFRFDYDEENDITAGLINEGQYYRVQIAFVKDDEVGYYSTVGVIKCVAKPTVYIAHPDSSKTKFEKDEINSFDNVFLGVYQQNTTFGDSTEKAYSYKFDIFDNIGTLVLSSGEKVHDITEDAFSDRSDDTWLITRELTIGEVYKLRYTVTTLNGLIVSTVDYRIMRAVPVDPEYHLKIFADANFEEGFIDVHLEGETDNPEQTFVYQIIPQDAEYDSNLVYYVKVENNYVEYMPEDNEDMEEYLGTWNLALLSNRLYIRSYSMIYGEKPCSGNFLITRASERDDYFEWIEIVRFTISSNYPSEYHFSDYSVEQGVHYKYALQQYNTHNIYSKKIYQTNKQGQKSVTMADFEDMFLSDATRKLKIRFNPKVTSFKNTIPEQKIETIGSKYPFIFRNGSVCYKEFPIGGLISFQMDNAFLFLNEKEREQAGIIEIKNSRITSNIDDYSYNPTHHEVMSHTKYRYQVPIYYIDIDGNQQIAGYRVITTDANQRKPTVITQRYDRHNTDSNAETSYDEIPKDEKIMRQDLNLTSENISSERYFKLKVLDWLTDGKVKLFRSPTEGNYLVRLLNVSLTPQDPLGRMIHSFTCTAYEIDELNYANLIAFGIVSPAVSSHFESQWSSVDVNNILKENITNDGFIRITPDDVFMESVKIQDFAPGDQIQIKYESGPDGIFSIGVTGSLELNNDDRKIIEVGLKPNKAVNPYNDFSRSFLYQTINVQLTKFDAITDYKTFNRVAEQFIGPIDNLLEPYILKDNAYGLPNEDGVILKPMDKEDAANIVREDLEAHHRFTYKINNIQDKYLTLSIDHLHVHKKNIIPVYCYTIKWDSIYTNNQDNNQNNIYTNKFSITPFEIPYVNSTNIQSFINSTQDGFKYIDNVIVTDQNGNPVRTDGVNIEDIVTILNERGITYSSYDLLEPYFYYIPTEEWISFKDYPDELPLPIGYYDLYKREWWDPTDVYDPTFSINDLQTNFDELDEYGSIISDPDVIIGNNNIALIELNEMTLYNIENIQHLRLGSGVVAEVTAQIQEITYEVEDIDPETKESKDKYLNAKDTLDRLIDMIMMNVDEIKDAELEYEDILNHIEEIKEQINLYNQGGNANSGVMDIAATRLVNQKKKAWFTLEKQIEDILDILINYPVFLNVTTPTVGLSNYYYNDDQAEDQEFNDEKKLAITNNPYLFKNPSEIKTIDFEDGEEPQQYKTISDAHLFYRPQYEAISNNAQQTINNCDNQLRNIAISKNKIYGGNVEDYDEDHLPPADTMAYAQYQINQLKTQIAKALETCNASKSKYVSKIIQIILSELANDNNSINKESIAQITDNYIKETANSLSDYINGIRVSIINTVNDENNHNTYNLEKINDQLAILQAQYELLIELAQNINADKELEIKIKKVDLPATTKNLPEGSPIAVANLIDIRNNYINATSNIVNMNLKDITSNGANTSLSDIFDLNKDVDPNQRIITILNVLTNEYNKESANTVQKYLKEYFYINPKEKEKTKDELLEEIKRINGIYVSIETEASGKIKEYEALIKKYEGDINGLEVEEESAKEAKQNAMNEKEKADKQLWRADMAAECLESENLINSIIKNKEHQNNVQLAIQYTEWLERTQSKLLDQIGQILSNITTGRDYANLLLAYINAYEVEAFKFLHPFDALEVDLHEGYMNSGGIDKLYNRLHEYWLSSYDDILFLKENKLTIRDINNLTNPDEEIRRSAYQDLKEHLEEILLDKDLHKITIGILCDKQQGYRLVQLDMSGEDIYYPDIYELNDLELKSPIELTTNQYLLPDTINYNINNCQLRVVTDTSHKDPRAQGYYTYTSSLTPTVSLISAFDKNINDLTDEEFSAVARLAASNNRPLKWLTSEPPVSFEIAVHPYLFNTLTYENSFNDFDTSDSDPNVFNIMPDYHTYFDKTLGLLIYDYENNDEYGSWIGLRDINKAFFITLKSYLIAHVKNQKLSNTNSEIINEYNRLSKLALEMESQLASYRKIERECSAVLDNYNAQQIDPESSKYQQLVILLETARDEIIYYIQWRDIYKAQLTKIEQENIDFKDYLYYKQSIIDNKKYLNELLEDYEEQYTLYSKKANHYIMLLFNTEPYGHNIDQDVLQDRDLLIIGGNKTEMYNFGLAYAIEAYKSNRDNDNAIGINEVHDAIVNLNKILNNHFEFVFLLPRYVQIEDLGSYSNTIKYFIYDKDTNTYNPYTVTSENAWMKDVQQGIIFIKNPEPYSDEEKSYYIKDNGKFVPYRYVDDKQWLEDRDMLDIYYTYYPSLIDFANEGNYRLINSIDSYDPNETYYYKTDDDRYEIVPVDFENWEAAVANGHIHIKVGNGGLKKFLYNLLSDSEYFNQIKNNYLGTYSLYTSLLADYLNNTTSIENLNLILQRNENRKIELEDILQYKNVDFDDINKHINEIYKYWAEYLVNLTHAYVNLVERSYAAV